MRQVVEIAERILEMRNEMPVEQGLLAGISGIDASGKGFFAAQVVDQLQRHSIKTAPINVDGWLNFPGVRFGGDEMGKHFYDHALRLDEMFARLILPLNRGRSIRLDAELTAETARAYHQFEYVFDNIDVILLEGIFIFKNQYIEHFDLKIWIECSFETALRLAIARSQEGLDPVQTITAYETIYFPAQRFHFELDDPQSTVAFTITNDARHKLTGLPLGSERIE